VSRLPSHTPACLSDTGPCLVAQVVLLVLVALPVLLPVLIFVGAL
jgi:hypothetical protein